MFQQIHQNNDLSATLFETLGITEIKKYLADSRIRIQKNQEELKQCARNNYHGLLKTTDLIQKLGEISSKLASTQGSTGIAFSALSPKPKNANSPVKLKEAVNPETDYVIKISKKIKLLVDMPEQIWNALEGLQFLEASKLCLFAEEIYEDLMASLIPPHQTPALKFFPVISSQWDILQNVRSSVSYRARKMLQITAYNPEEIFKGLVSIFYIDGLGPIDVIKVFLEGREQAIWKAFSELTDPVDFHTAKDFLQQIIYWVHTTIRGILHLFIVNGSVFFNISTKVPISLLNFPIFSTKSNWPEMILLLNSVSPDEIDFQKIETPSARCQVSLPDINSAVEAWFLSLSDLLRVKIGEVLELKDPLLVSQIHHFLGHLLDELHVPSLVNTEFSGLFYDLGSEMWMKIFHESILDLAMNALKDITSQSEGLQNELKREMDQAQIPQDYSVSMWELASARDQLEARISGKSYFVISTQKKVLANRSFFAASCQNLLAGPRNYLIFELEKSAQEIYTLNVETWCEFVAGLLENQSDYRKNIQLGKLLETFQESSDSHNLRDSQRDALGGRILELCDKSYNDWFLHLSSVIKHRLAEEWPNCLKWDISQEVPAHFVQDDLTELGHLPSQTTPSLLAILFDLNDAIISVLGRPTRKTVIQGLCHHIWSHIWPELSTMLLTWPLKNPTVSTLQGIFDVQFLYTVLMGRTATGENPSPLVFLGDHCDDLIKNRFEINILKHLSSTIGLMGGIAPDFSPNQIKDSAKASPFHNVLAMAAPWKRFRLIE